MRYDILNSFIFVLFDWLKCIVDGKYRATVIFRCGGSCMREQVKDGVECESSGGKKNFGGWRCGGSQKVNTV